MAECLKRDDVWQMLHDLGGCEDNFSSLAFDNVDITWANGWDKAIEAAIGDLDKLPAVELVEGNKIYLKPCPFCGGTHQIFSRTFEREPKWRIKCGCGHYSPQYNSLEKAAEAWNRRYSERTGEESEVEENA